MFYLLCRSSTENLLVQKCQAVSKGQNSFSSKCLSAPSERRECQTLQTWTPNGACLCQESHCTWKWHQRMELHLKMNRCLWCSIYSGQVSSRKEVASTRRTHQIYSDWNSRWWAYHCCCWDEANVDPRQRLKILSDVNFHLGSSHPSRATLLNFVSTCWKGTSHSSVLTMQILCQSCLFVTSSLFHWQGPDPFWWQFSCFVWEMHWWYLQECSQVGIQSWMWGCYANWWD